MKIVIAPDSFKDSLEAAGVARAIAAGITNAWPEAECIECPMADGGRAPCRPSWRPARANCVT